MRSVPIQWDHWRSFIAVAEEGSRKGHQDTARRALAGVECEGSSGKDCHHGMPLVRAAGYHRCTGGVCLSSERSIACICVPIRRGRHRFDRASGQP